MENKIFSTEVINRERQNELDFAKAMMLFFLALIHCTIACTPEPQLAYGIPYLLPSSEVRSVHRCICLLWE